MTQPATRPVLAAGIILYRADAGPPRILLLRDRRRGTWGLPKGRRDPTDGDDDLATARREVAEETGYRAVALVDGFREELAYTVRDDGARYDKRVVYFLGRAPAHEPHLSGEHDDLTWATLRDALDLLAYGQIRDLARRAFAAIGET